MFCGASRAQRPLHALAARAAEPRASAGTPQRTRLAPKGSVGLFPAAACGLVPGAVAD